MLDDIRLVSELEITVHHEAGHAAIATLLGRPIPYLKLFHIIPTEEWRGFTSIDPSANIMAEWTIPDRHRALLPDPAMLRPYPDDAYRLTRDICTIKCAGLATEKLLGMDVSLLQPGGSTWDIEHARYLISQGMPLREQELLEAEKRASEVLNTPICWSMVVNLARGLIDAIHQGWEALRPNEATEVYTFDCQMLHGSFTQTLAQCQLEREN